MVPQQRAQLIRSCNTSQPSTILLNGNSVFENLRPSAKFSGVLPQIKSYPHPLKLMQFVVTTLNKSQKTFLKQQRKSLKFCHVWALCYKSIIFKLLEQNLQTPSCLRCRLQVWSKGQQSDTVTNTSPFSTLLGLLTGWNRTGFPQRMSDRPRLKTGACLGAL